MKEVTRSLKIFNQENTIPPTEIKGWCQRCLNLAATKYYRIQEKLLLKIAKEKAETEFEKYPIIQERFFVSDYVRLILEIRGK